MSYSDDLRSRLSKFRRKCFLCPYDDCGACVRCFSDDVKIHPTINDFTIVTCLLCHRNWFVCLLCSGNQQSLLSESAAKKHISNQHRTSSNKRKGVSPQRQPRQSKPASSQPSKYQQNVFPKAKCSSPSISIGNVITNMSSSLNEHDDEFDIGSLITFDVDHLSTSANTDGLVETTPTSLPKLENTSSFAEFEKFLKSSSISNNDKTRKCFHNYDPISSQYYSLIDNNHYGAATAIVAKANNLNVTSSKTLSEEETKEQILLAKFVRSLSKNQQLDFSQLLLFINKTHIMKEMYNSIQTSNFCNLPSKLSDLR
jgi:hypothetical protein